MLREFLPCTCLTPPVCILCTILNADGSATQGLTHPMCHQAFKRWGEKTQQSNGHSNIFTIIARPHYYCNQLCPEDLQVLRTQRSKWSLITNLCPSCRPMPNILMSTVCPGTRATPSGWGTTPLGPCTTVCSAAATGTGTPSPSTCRYARKRAIKHDNGRVVERTSHPTCHCSHYRKPWGTKSAR